ncbi:MAG: AMP-binding protein, partial [Ignavibacteriaceae bacterium]|nr:AMP-binding protein [Ignavibacteriaceae bacterium]
MPILAEFKTIPAIYKHLTEQFGKGKERPFLQHKVDNNYVGITYSEFQKQTEELAFGLAQLGVKRGEKVSIIAENRPEWVYADMAVLGLGGVDVPLYPISTSDTIEFILNNSESIGIIVSNNFHLNKVLKVRDKCKTLKFIIVMNEMDVSQYDKVYTFSQVMELGKGLKNDNPSLFKDSLNIAAPDDTATIIYTSGTTGEPKGVVLTHWNIMSNVQSAHKSFPIDENDIFLSFLPLCHIFERMAGYYTAVSCGAMICYAESIEKIAQNMTEVKPTVMTAVPRLFERMHSKIIKNVESQPEKKQKIFQWALEVGKLYFEAGKDGRSIPIGLTIKHKLADKLVFKKLRERTGGRLRFFISGGAALSRDLGEFFVSAGIKIIEGYGLTE